MTRSIRTAGVFIVAALVGCGDSTTAPSDADFVGTYSLILVGGAAVPTVIATGDGDVEITAGQLVFAFVGACSGSITVREPGGGPTQEMTNTCTWTRNGNQILVTWSDGAADQATLQGRRVTLVAADLGGLVLTFEK